MNNYHTHTYRCKHASGDVADYVEEARRAGLGELGFSDHTPLPDGRWPENRMGMDELPGYLAAVEAARLAEEARPDEGQGDGSGRGRLRILRGLECEWSPDYDSFIRDELLGRRKLDYLVSGTHFYLKGGVWEDSASIRQAAGLVAYAAHMERSIQSGLFAFIAHPDLYCLGYLAWDEAARACARDILAAASAARIPVEINGYGMRKPRVRGPDGPRWPYPREAFWDLAAEYEITIVANSDAHRPSDVAAGLETGAAMATRRGLRLLDALPATPRRA